MFGPELPPLTRGDLTVTLAPIEEKWIELFARNFSKYWPNRYIGMDSGVTERDEKEWFSRTRGDRKSRVWGIYVDDKEEPAGVTSLNSINTRGGCWSGITIFEEHHGKGIATLAHVLRTRFAANQLGRSRINSFVMAPNKASWRALERVGYYRWGIEPAADLVDGKYVDEYRLAWFHPDFVDIFFRDRELPEGLEHAIAKARQVLGPDTIRYLDIMSEAGKRS